MFFCILLQVNHSMKISQFTTLLIPFLLLSCSASKGLQQGSASAGKIQASHIAKLSLNMGYSIKSFAPIPNDTAWSMLFSGTQGIYLLADDSLRLISKDLVQALDARPFSLLDGSSFWMVAAILRGDNVLRAYKWTSEGKLEAISAGDIPCSVDQVTDVRLFADSGQDFAFVVGQRGQLEKWRLYDPGWGQVDGSIIANQSSPFPGHFINIEGNSLCGSSLNKGVWCLDIDGGRTTPVKKRELSKDQVKAKLTVKGMTQLPDKTLLITWSDGKIERVSSGEMQSLGFMEVMHGEEPILGAELPEWIPAGIWASYPKGCLVLLSKQPGSARIVLVDGADLLKG